VFHPPTATGHNGEDPISLKKLITEGEGLWDTVKKILGWIFNGLERTIQLPPKKVTSLQETIKTALRSERIKFKAFESLIGKCQHACLGILGGRSLLPPLYKVLKVAKLQHSTTVQIHPRSPQHGALSDLRTFFKLLGDNPVQCQQLIPGNPAYLGYCNACKYGGGGVWISGTQNIHPIVWRVKWPQDIVDRVSSEQVTINNLEMAGLLL
jgi:hypothetical protein